MANNIKRAVKRLVDRDPQVRQHMKAHGQQMQEIIARLNTVEGQLAGLQPITPDRSTVLQTGPNEVIVKLFNGQKICLGLNDLSVAPHLALDGIWESEITKAWQSIMKPRCVVFDIGANFGYYGLISSQLLDMKHSKVIYFEPNPKLIPYIERTLAVNWLVENSKVENVAVSDSNGIAKLSVLRDYIGSSSLHSIEHLQEYLGETMHLEAQEVVEVPTVTIDSYCKAQKIANVDLVKLDVEGFEQQAYAGMRKILAASKDVVLFIEFTAKSYKDPKSFFEQIMGDFGHLALINDDGTFSTADTMSFEEVIGLRDDWIMLVFSKKLITQDA